ncbi:thioredoxin family protein [Mangrovibacterium diazotrophicum]|uniref:Thioredoxin n=1 Tax=Mangrovibacterium diazotrophicum TaxID=1261403 RepID=A0A419W660_9BACT|nr:thioredoxin family protein [Mangrovibacterium diazotrophicum]RKD90926.1 thioredoxin [Mangrovibacterium diazotrophicum]
MIKTRNKLVAVLLFGVLFAGQALAQGIDFKHIDFEVALDQAKEQDKLIFIDFYTEWCGPCKKLAAGPFKEQANGDFYNQNFISLKLDAEKEGKEAAARYKVTAYPTMLFVNGDGDIVHMGVGVTKGYDMIGFGKEALNAATAKYSWEKLQTMYPNKQDDEAFLKLYLQKMDEFGSDASEGIDAWLKVQTEFDESSEEMLQFLMKNRENMYCGTKAEEIFNANYEHYLTLVSGNQRINVERFRQGMFARTLKKAERSGSASLMQVLIDRYQQYGIKPRANENLQTFQMDYYRFLKDYDTFKQLAENYVDSLMNLESVKEIHESDAELYKSYSKGKVAGKDAYTDLMLERYKEGMTAGARVDAITEVGQNYLAVMEGNQETKTLNKWIDYCYELIPGQYWVDNLKADLLYKEGKTKDAIALKSAAIEKMPFNVKKKVNFQHELELMVQNEN